MTRKYSIGTKFSTELSNKEKWSETPLTALKDKTTIVCYSDGSITVEGSRIGIYKSRTRYCDTKKDQMRQRLIRSTENLPSLEPS